MSSTAEMALKYAAGGWPVFPCNLKKRPLTKTGFKEASTDESKIREWWIEYKDASIGVPTGKNIGAWVLDIDLPEGPQTLNFLEQKHGSLPKTLEQKTGSGGKQLFFKLPPSGLIRNNAKTKLGPGLDIRGDGGYVIVPPSKNENGQYQWLSAKGTEIADAPQWLLNLVLSKDQPIQKQRSSGPTSAYGEAALARELAALSSAGQGERNHQLNTSAFALGQLIAGGELDRSQAETALTGIALALGLDQRETEKTIQSGLNGGGKEPRSAPRDLEYTTNSQPCQFSQLGQFSQLDQQSSVKVSQGSVKGQSEVSQKSVRGQSSDLYISIKEWVENSSGSFTSQDVDREFGLTSKEEKRARNNVLYYLVNKNKIERDKNKKGKYHVVIDDVEEVNWDEDHQEEFPVSLPLGLDRMVSISPRNIILVEGCGNAGKTAFCINILAANLRQDYPLWYLFSEGSPGEVKRRLSSGQVDFSLWKSKVHAAFRSSLQHQVIKSKNPDGLTIIDFLEPMNGEYYRLGTQISEIGDSLQAGLVVVCVQKKTGAEIGRGGEAIREKPRLTLAIDLLEKGEAYIICSLKINKCKRPKVDGKNPDGKECHFAISHGFDLHLLSDWGYFKEEQRKKLLPGYVADMQATLGLGDIPQGQKRRLSYAYEFKMADGTTKGINFDDVEKWKVAFPNTNVEFELKLIQEKSLRSPWLNPKNWFFMLNGMLAKQDQKILDQKDGESGGSFIVAQAY